jgi:hypothetical protein
MTKVKLVKLRCYAKHRVEMSSEPETVKLQVTLKRQLEHIPSFERP